MVRENFHDVVRNEKMMYLCELDKAENGHNGRARQYKKRRRKLQALPELLSKEQRFLLIFCKESRNSIRNSEVYPLLFALSKKLPDGGKSQNRAGSPVARVPLVSYVNNLLLLLLSK